MGGPMLHPGMDLSPEQQQQAMQHMMRRQEQAARRMVTKIENLIEGDEGGPILEVDLMGGLGAQDAADPDEGMIWKVWRGFRAVGSAVGRTIFWCNRADEEEAMTADNASARVFSECSLAINRHIATPTNEQPRVKIWRESFSKLCLASRAGRRPILALVLREESDQHAQQAAKFLNQAQDSAINELL